MDSKIINSVCPKDCFGPCSLQVQVKNGKAIKIKGNSNNPVTGG